ncbi:TPA: ead/Ea22-like family protein [Klebsiella michiganensis]
MTTDITELAQRNELLIANGQQTADLLRHLADNEIDSDYFAVVSECESYGKETDAELSITEFALRAAGYVDALVEALEKAQQAININNQWKPDVCPITGRRFFLWIEHPELGYVPTYGGPYDSYTIPTRDSDGEFSCERYDHDFGGWVDGECVGAYLIDDDEQCRVYELEQRIAELESRTVKLPDDAEHDIMAPVAAYLSEKFKWDGGAARWDGRKEYDVLADRVKYALRMVIRRAAGIKWEAE